MIHQPKAAFKNRAILLDAQRRRLEWRVGPAQSRTRHNIPIASATYPTPPEKPPLVTGRRWCADRASPSPQRRHERYERSDHSPQPIPKCRNIAVQSYLCSAIGSNTRSACALERQSVCPSPAPGAWRCASRATTLATTKTTCHPSQRQELLSVATTVKVREQAVVGSDL